MIKKFSIGFVTVAVVVAIYLLLAPRKILDPAEFDSGGAPPRETEAPDVSMPKGGGIPFSGDESGDALQREAMAAAYAELEAARKELKSRLGAIKATLWGVRMPVAQSRSVSHSLMQAHALLNNAPMLGAFSNANEIERERNRVESALARLAEIEGILEAARAAADAPRPR